MFLHLVHYIEEPLRHTFKYPRSRRWGSVFKAYTMYPTPPPYLIESLSTSSRQFTVNLNSSVEFRLSNVPYLPSIINPLSLFLSLFRGPLLPPSACGRRRLPDLAVQTPAGLLPVPPCGGQPFGVDPLHGERALGVAADGPGRLPGAAAARAHVGKAGAHAAQQGRRKGTVQYRE